MNIPDSVFNFIGVIWVMLATSWFTLKMNKAFSGGSLGHTPKSLKWRSIQASITLLCGLYLIFAF
jgi:hypothetical protein